jgi:hypothetical protein
VDARVRKAGRQFAKSEHTIGPQSRLAAWVISSIWSWSLDLISFALPR